MNDEARAGGLITGKHIMTIITIFIILFISMILFGRRLMKNVDKVCIKCKHCGYVIRPDSRGTFIECYCGKCAVDGKYDENGEGYCRIIGNKEDYDNLSYIPIDDIKELVDSKKKSIKYTAKKH